MNSEEVREPVEQLVGGAHDTAEKSAGTGNSQVESLELASPAGEPFEDVGVTNTQEAYSEDDESDADSDDSNVDEESDDVESTDDEESDDHESEEAESEEAESEEAESTDDTNETTEDESEGDADNSNAGETASEAPQADDSEAEAVPEAETDSPAVHAATGSRVNNAKLVGRAIVALRATIKALEMASGHFQRSTGRYRYEIANDRSSARIVDAANGNEPVEGQERTLEEWADEGKAVRLAFIGLKDAKLKLEAELQSSGKPGYVRFTLDILQGRAFLSRNGEVLTTPPQEMRPWDDLGLGELPQDIETWAKIGRKVEKPLFESLKAAQEWGSASGMAETREKMIQLGIIRAPRQQDN